MTVEEFSKQHGDLSEYAGALRFQNLIFKAVRDKKLPREFIVLIDVVVEEVFNKHFETKYQQEEALKMAKEIIKG